MPLTAQDVREKSFTKSIKGYTIEEVDAFLDEVIAEFDRLYQIVNGLKARNTKTDKCLQEYIQMERSLRSVMFLADQTSKKMVEEAKNKANEIVNNARLEGEKVVEGLQSKIQNTRQQLQQMEGQAADLGLSIRGMIEQQEAFLAVQKKTLEATLLGDLPENDAEAAPVADGPAEGAMDLEEQETRVIPAVDMEEDAADDAELAQDDMPLGE